MTWKQEPQPLGLSNTNRSKSATYSSSLSNNSYQQLSDNNGTMYNTNGNYNNNNNSHSQHGFNSCAINVGNLRAKSPPALHSPPMSPIGRMPISPKSPRQRQTMLNSSRNTNNNQNTNKLSNSVNTVHNHMSKYLLLCVKCKASIA